MAIEQWEFFRIPHLLWHRASIYSGHLRGPVTLAPNAERWAVELSLPVLTTYVCRGLDSNTQPSTSGVNALTHCPWATAILFCLFGVYCPTWEFFTDMETSPLPVKCCKFWPMLGTHGQVQWGFFSVPHLMWHRASVYNGHLRGPVTLAPIAERLVVELSLRVFMT